ncbi:MAG: hypothetical protein WCT29_00665 [Candidatus Paceibacterota bacterium]|jgi:hypothetical protein
MKKHLTILFLTVLIIPSIASATWWNPLSWSKNSKQIDTIEPTSTKPVEKSIPVSETKTTESKVVERIVEKPTIQTITVQDPALQARVNILVAENESLKAQVGRLLESNKSLNKELLACEDTPASTFSADDQCEYAQDSLKDFLEQYTELSAEISKEREKIKKNPESAEKPYIDIYHRSGLNAMLSSFNISSSQKLKPLIKGKESAESAVALYCN